MLTGGESLARVPGSVFDNLTRVSGSPLDLVPLPRFPVACVGVRFGSIV